MAPETSTAPEQHREAQLRGLLEEIDGRLIELMTSGKRSSGKRLRRIARYEGARAAVLRLLECPTPNR